METKRMSRRKKLLPAGGIVLIALAAAFFLYASDYYHADGEALAVLAQEGGIEVRDGLILLGAYIYGDYPPENTLTVYGSLNQSVEDNIDYAENVVEIEGGNHAQFGNYGPQKGDSPATITAAEQQEQTVEAISAFLASAR